ncbi:MAG: DUF6261 family protein [Alistipes sp.]|jgi:hypothetical protein|nr:DUF6261 family protein [Alistipes sp.]
MKIEKLHMSRLHNGEHFEFHTVFSGMVKAATPVKLKIEALWEPYTALYADLDEALKKITKSEHTARINQLDTDRDSIYRGMVDAVRSASNHFKADIRAAAGRLQIVFDTYGNVTAMTHDEESAMIANLLKDITVKYAADCEALGLNGWIGELDRLNEALKAAVMERYDETAGRSSLVLREVRGRIDGAYRVLAERVDALQIVEGGAADAPWAAFIAELNAVIERANNNIAIREGIAAAEKAREEVKE